MASTEKRMEAASGILSLWNMEKAAEREQYARKCISEDLNYADPHVPAPMGSIEEFLKFLEVFRTNVSDAEVNLSGEPKLHNDYGRINFAIDRSGNPFSTGTFFLTFNSEDKIAQIVGFVN